MSNNIVFRILGLSKFSRKERGLAYIYLVTFVPMIYKLIVPFFVILGLSSYTIIINPIIMIIGLILAKELFWANIRQSSIICFIIYALTLYLLQFLYPETKPFYDENYYRFIFQVAIFFFIGLSITEKHTDILVFVAHMAVIVQVFWQSCYLLGIVQKEASFDDSLGEQMELAYQLLFPIIILIMDLSRRISLKNIIYLFVALLLLLFMGTRGPILVCAAFIVGYYVLINRFERKNLLKKFLITASFVFFYLFIVPITEFIAPLAAHLGFSTRVFDSIIGQRMIDIDESSGRDYFYQSVYDSILNNDGFGYGWGGDRLCTPTGGYAHNFELEILCQYGWILGGIILVVLFVYIIKTYVKCEIQDERNMLFSLFCIGLLSLQLSLSYVIYPLFFVFIGYMVSLNRRHRRLRIHNK